MTLLKIAIIMLLLIAMFTILSIAIYFARQFDKVLDKPEETVKEDEHANNIGI